MSVFAPWLECRAQINQTCARMLARALLYMAFAASIAAADEPPKADYQANLDCCLGWAQVDGFMLVHSMKQSHSPGCAITVAQTAGSRVYLDVGVKDAKGWIRQWKGHWDTPIVIRGNRLYYAEYNPADSGGTVVAVDLSERTVVWRSDLRGLGRVPHFAYGNRIYLDFDYTDRGVIYIFGDESAGRYIEAKLLSTGETVAHKRIGHGPNTDLPPSPEPDHESR